jgi:four helix bundle protein
LQNFRNLRVWQKSHSLVLSIYTLTAKYPKDEMYGLTSQIRRAAVSIPANIAEGCARGGDPEFSRFLTIAQGSASELDYHLLLSHDLKLITKSDYEKLCGDLTQIRRMLTTFKKTLDCNKG